MLPVCGHANHEELVGPRNSSLSASFFLSLLFCFFYFFALGFSLTLMICIEGMPFKYTQKM